MNGEQRESLERFIRAEDGEYPPVFVGRQNIMLEIEQAVREGFSERSVKQGKPKATRVLQGAPGAGKTSILNELDRRSVDYGRTAADMHSVLILSSQSLQDMESVMGTVSVAAGLSSRIWRRGLMKKVADAGAATVQSVTEIAGIRQIVGFFTGQIGGTPRSMLEFSAKFPGEKWKKPLVIAIDEAQRLDWPVNSPQSAFLQHLHDSDLNLPILMVLSGLGDTKDRMEAMQLTRLSRNHGIGCLSREDRKKYLRRFCDRFGLSSAVGRTGESMEEAEQRRLKIQANLQKLIDETRGWPRHMHHAFQALGDCATLVDGDLSKVRWDAVHEGAADRRNVYYEYQFSPQMKSSVCLTSAVLDGLADGMKLAGVDSLIRRSIRDEDGWRLPKGMDTEDYRQHLVHRGALQECLDGIYHSPIPSFRRYLIDEGKCRDSL